MKKFGFTLAEILIALTVVGVVSALTIPTVVTGSQNQANASKLSSTASSFESAFTTMIAMEVALDIYETEAWKASSTTDFMDKLTRYVKVTDSETGADLPSMKTLGGGDYSGTLGLGDNAVTLETKNGSTVYIERNTSSTTNAGRLVVDTNGSVKPNKLGRDIFGFVIGPGGQLYPYGSPKANKVDVYSCDADDGAGCTYKLVKDGYRMNY